MAPGLDAAHAGAEGVLLADGSGDDGLKIHDDVAEEMLRQVGAVEADGLVRVVAVVVVPVEQRARCFRSECQRVHAQGPDDIHFTGAENQVLAHHAHNRAGHHAEVFFERGPALDRADRRLRLLHPLLDHPAQLRHLHQRRFGNLPVFT